MKIYRILAEVAVPNCVKREDVEREVEQTLGRETDWVNCAEILEVKRVDVTLHKVAKTAKGSEVRGRMGEGGDEMKRLLYHATPKENVESIKRNGLIPKCAFVSPSEQKDSWIKDGYALFEVNVKGLNLYIHTYLPELDEIAVGGKIEPSRLRLISESAGEEEAK